ncbi:hypothetical protein [Streptomyces sp. NPDC007088]|uniref:hypothetical protein n=1 Tax=Streptomyces sp. NPDC007088 TaxID=3364773 RepID=UPI0036BA98C7
MATFCALLVLLLFSIDDRDYRTGHRTALDVVVPQCATTPTAPGAGAQRPQP